MAERRHAGNRTRRWREGRVAEPESCPFHTLSGVFCARYVSRTGMAATSLGMPGDSNGAIAAARQRT
jgi:hypothetical protein